MFSLFIKACTNGYVVNSCLAPPINLEGKAVPLKTGANVTNNELLGHWEYYGVWFRLRNCKILV